MPANQAPTTSNDTADFEKFKARVNEVIAEWGQNESTAIEARRTVRRFDNNTEALQASGELNADETKIPRRVIHANIMREKPSYAAYIEQSTRLVLFKAKDQPDLETAPLADWFTAGMRYTGWNTPWHATIDGMLLHGGTFIEVRLDSTKPFGIALEAVPRDGLIIPCKTRKSIQRVEMILRMFEYMPMELEAMVQSAGFSAVEVERLLEKSKDKERQTPVKCYRVFMKRGGVVHDAWYTEGAQSYLRGVEPVNMFPQRGEDGNIVVGKPLTSYPFFYAQYEIIEDELLLNVKGRAMLDLADQDALTGLWSSTVNGAKKASNVYASRRLNPANPEGNAAAVLQPNKASPDELNFFQANFPPADLLSIAQALTTENMSGIGQVDFAANNRQDSRKTAREIAAATQQAGLLSGVRLVPFSNCIRETYDFVWEVLTWLVGINAVKPPTNIAHYFQMEYYVFPAGDTEVIQRAEKLAALQAFYPVVAATPIGPLVLSKIIELQFPIEAPKWNSTLAQPDLRPIVMQLAQIIAALPPDSMPPNTANQVQAILTNVQSVLQSTNMAGGPPQLSGPSANGAGAGQPAGAQAG